jgi:hypothetical protein
MPLPTDRGYVLVTKEDDGTQTIMVCAGITNGEPVDVYAMHVRSSSVVIHPDVKLVRAGSVSYTNKVVEVFADEAGTVHVAGAQSGKGRLIGA